MTEQSNRGTFTAKDPTILTCGECDQEVYRATAENYTPAALWKAFLEHQERCPKRTEASP
jgi:hypothetical protein